jgi:drug/metabolite transporter (DMT)-like permease
MKIKCGMHQPLLKSKRIAFIALLLGTVALAFAPIFCRLSDTSPSSITFWRMALSTPLLATLWLFLPAPQRNYSYKPRMNDYLGLVAAGIFFALDLIIWNVALGFTSVAIATLFVNFAVVFVALFTWFLLRKPLGSGFIVGMIIALIGSVLLIWPHLGSTDHSLLGDGLSLFSAIFYAVYILLLQAARQSFGTMWIMTITGAVSTITACFMAWVLGETLSVETFSSWQALLGLALVVQVLGQGLVTYALADLPATLSSVVLLLQPVIASFIAWHLFDESLALVQIIGMGIILTGISFAKITYAKIEVNNL